MKAVNKILRVLVMVFGLASLVLFFTKFANVVLGDANASFVGAQLAFGSKATVGETVHNLETSGHLTFCFWLTAIAALLSFFTFKSKKIRYAVSGLAIADAIYLLVIRLRGAYKFVDIRPLDWNKVTSLEFTPFVTFLVIALVLFAICAVAHLLLDDYIEVMDSNGDKLTIPKRVVRFLRDYKSEGKKIVWPTFKDVVKNTIVVLIMCLVVGALIWIVDFGLGQLLNLILGV